MGIARLVDVADELGLFVSHFGYLVCASLGTLQGLGGLEPPHLVIVCLIHGNRHLSTIFLEFPVSVVKGTDLSGFEPSRDAMEVEGMLWSN